MDKSEPPSLPLLLFHLSFLCYLPLFFSRYYCVTVILASHQHTRPSLLFSSPPFIISLALLHHLCFFCDFFLALFVTTRRPSSATKSTARSAGSQELHKLAPTTIVCVRVKKYRLYFHSLLLILLLHMLLHFLQCSF